jgi:sulfoxide reductase heme-binding subunit YedZ
VARRRSLAVPLAVALGLLPAGKLVLDALTGGLGANPIEQVLNRLGFWTLTFLAAALAATPAKELLGLSWAPRIRRALGLLAFGYAAAHLACYAGVDQFFDWPAIVADVTKRKFIAVGFATFLLLVPLAATSTDAWVRRLGYRRWKALHRLAYAAAAGGVVHFAWRVKVDLLRPAIFAAVIGALLLLRLVPARRRSTAPPPPGSLTPRT